MATPRCTYASADGQVRCAKPAHVGAYCKAHAPRQTRMVRVECRECGGGGLIYELDLTVPCYACRGRGHLTVPAVIMRRRRKV